MFGTKASIGFNTPWKTAVVAWTGSSTVRVGVSGAAANVGAAAKARSPTTAQSRAGT